MKNKNERGSVGIWIFIFVRNEMEERNEKCKIFYEVEIGKNVKRIGKK